MADAPISKDRLEKDWWDRWWGADYSWEGLAGLTWEGWSVDKTDGTVHPTDSDVVQGAADRFRRATLQDYWRDQEGDLVRSPDGALAFTRAHLPLAWPDGSATDKGSWPDDALDALLAPRLAAGAETDVSTRGQVEGVDKRAQLQGTVLLRATPHPQGAKAPLHLKANGACFLRRATFFRQVFGAGVWLAGVAFFREARFDRATFAGVARFANVAFFGDAGFEHATFSGPTRFDSVACRGDARFANATFSDYAGFDSAQFSGDAQFQSGTFAQGVRLDSATFLGHSRFDRTVMSGDAGFDRAIFFNDVRFDSATFTGHARFEGAQFRGDVGFQKATFSAGLRLYNGVFLKDVRFHEASFVGDARFDGVKFKGEARFDRAAFALYAGFSKAAFARLAEFTKATFSREAEFAEAAFAGVARYSSATFAGNATFDKATFAGDAKFTGAAFASDARFVGGAFSGGAEFVSAKFARSVVFDDAKFLSETGRVNFRTAVFSSTAHFWRTQFPRKLACVSKAFTAARFEDVVDFTGSGTHWVSGLADVVFKSHVLIDDPGEAAADREFRSMILPATRAAASTYLAQKIAEETEQREGQGKRIRWYEKRRWRREREDWRFDELEAGCRALKHAMGEQRNEGLEQRYYRFQLRAQRARRGTPLAVKIFSFLYALTSNYGGSVWRPFVVLGVMLAASAAGFWAWANALAGWRPEAELFGWNGRSDAASFAWSNVFRPFSALGDGEGPLAKNMVTQQLLIDAGQGWAFAARAVATLESLLAIVLAFLFALAIRRRFQIG